MKQILISDCNKYPYRTLEKKPIFNELVRIPVCRKSNRRVLPFVNERVKGILKTNSSGVIPDWCQINEQK